MIPSDGTVSMGSSVSIGLAGFVSFTDALSADTLVSTDDAVGLDSLASAGKSGTLSSVEVGLSECRPIGLSGRRRVPLLGFGFNPKESQTML